MPLNEELTPEQEARRQLRMDVAEALRDHDGGWQSTNHEYDEITAMLVSQYGPRPLAEMVGADPVALRAKVRGEASQTIHVRATENGGALCTRIAEGDRLEEPLNGIYANCEDCLRAEARME